MLSRASVGIGAQGVLHVSSNAGVSIINVWRLLPLCVELRSDQWVGVALCLIAVEKRLVSQADQTMVSVPLTSRWLQNGLAVPQSQPGHLN